jgi:predicted nucleic acid-binding protein
MHAERCRQTPADLIVGLMERWGDAELGVSVMSAGELFHGCWRAGTAARRASRQEFVEAILAAIPVIPITLAIARIFGEIDARLSAAGRRIPTSDLLIASTALSRGDEVVTGNMRHFDRVPGLVVHRLG